VSTPPPVCVYMLIVLRRRGMQTVKVDVQPGTAIVANWTGYVDHLYLAFRYAFRLASSVVLSVYVHIADTSTFQIPPHIPLTDPRIIVSPLWINNPSPH
jgi:hypothetical protein